MTRWQGFSRLTLSGMPAPSATVTVYISGSSTLATIYAADDLTQAKANPFTAGTDGFGFFYAANGLYDIQFSGGGITTPWSLGAVQLYAPSGFSIDAGNVRNYAAKGDGIADDGPAFLSAYNAAVAAGGGAIYVPPGTYKITSQALALITGFKLYGAGEGLATINWNGAGYWLDNNTATPTHDVEVTDLTINVSAAGSGPIRMGNRALAYNASAFSNRVKLARLEAFGQAVAGSIGFDLTQVGLDMSNVVANNFDEGYKFTTVVNSVFANLVSQGNITRGIHIINTQSGAVLAGMDSVFTGTTINGLQGTGIGLDLDTFQDLTFNGLFIERSSGTPTAIRGNAATLIGIDNLWVSGTGYTNILQLIDCDDITFSHSGPVDTGDVSGTSSITWSVANSKLNAWQYKGGIRFVDCNRAFNRQVVRIPRVTILGPDQHVGQSLFKAPLTGVTDLWAKSLANRQGLANVVETDFVLDAFHGQLTYDPGNSATIVVDANASKGYALQVDWNGYFGLEIPYPANLPLGMYELIVRGRVAAGTGAPSFSIDAVGVGNITTISPGVNWTTTYQVSAVRFNLTSANVGAGTAIRVSAIAAAGASTKWLLDYLVLRPAQNDVLLQRYVPPDIAGYDLTGAALLGLRLTTAASIPTTGTYIKGDFVFNEAPVIDGSNLVLLGWSRLTSGSAHLLNTDWAKTYVKTTSP